MKIIILICGLILTFSGCISQDVERNVPQCIEEIIKDLQNQEVWNPPAKVIRYRYDRQYVYYIPQHCCDFPSLLYDESCNLICSPDGGISGNGDGKCPDFFDNRTDEEIIWQDSR